MYCERCGAANPDGPEIRFCRSCGAELARKAAPAPDVPLVAQQQGPTPYSGAPALPPGAPTSAGAVAEVPVAAAPNLAFPFGGFWVRLVAYILDWAAILLVESFVGFFVLFTLGVGLALRGAGDEATGFVALALSSLAAILVTAGYYVLMPPLLGATLGKLALGYHIVGEDGRHIGYGRAFLRYVGYWLSSIALGLGFIWIGVDAHKQGWHDKVAGTYVVRREVVKP